MARYEYDIGTNTLTKLTDGPNEVVPSGESDDRLLLEVTQHKLFRKIRHHRKHDGDGDGKLNKFK